MPPRLEHTADEEFEDLGAEEEAPYGEQDDEYEPVAELPEAEVSIEERAAAQGWKPFAEYRGPPGKWTDAAEFLRRGEENWALMRDQNRRMSEKLARLEPEVATLRNTVTEQADAVKAAMNLARRANEQGYQRGLADLKAKQRTAVQTGDEEAYDQVQAQIDALEQTRAEVEEEPRRQEPTRQDPPAAPREVVDFRAANPWFDSSPELRQAMIGMHTAEIARDRESGRQRTLQQQLDAALRRMQAAYPEIVQDSALAEEEALPPETPPARPRPRVAPVGTPQTGMRQRVPPNTRADPFMQITDETERQACRTQFESIRRMDAGYTAAEHMAIYNDPKIDVLELRKQRKA